jgi:hypothetical protein
MPGIGLGHILGGPRSIPPTGIGGRELTPVRGQNSLMIADLAFVLARLLYRLTLESRIRALVFAADHQRLEVIDQLVEAGTPVNQADAEWGAAAAACCGGQRPPRQRPATARPRRRPRPPRPGPPPHRWRTASPGTATGTARATRRSEAILRPLTRQQDAEPLAQPGDFNRCFHGCEARGRAHSRSSRRRAVFAAPCPGVPNAAVVPLKGDARSARRVLIRWPGRRPQA